MVRCAVCQKASRLWADGLKFDKLARVSGFEYGANEGYISFNYNVCVNCEL